MKVLLVNSYDVGGAAKACIRLHEGLIEKGIGTNILFKASQKNLPFTEQFKMLPKKRTIIYRIKLKVYRILKELRLLKSKPKILDNQSFINGRLSKLELFSYPNSNCDITESKLYKEADIINLHWVSDFLDYESFFEKNTKPVIWTLHDMNPFSGGEHFTEEFLGIDEEGFPVKRKVSKKEKEIFLEIIELKLNALKNVSNLHIVVLCNWMLNEVKKSELFKDYPIHLIPNGINTSVFKPREKVFSREVFNIPQNKKVILFVADSLGNNRKGFAFLEKAFQELKEDVILCSIGKKNNSDYKFDNYLELGSIYDERLMSIAYSAADVFVIPSLMDNLPNTVLESIMCGTPIVGFPVGGILDVIDEGVNGLLTKNISVSSLVETLTLFLNTSNNFNKEIIRNNALKKYSQKVQSGSYIKLFTSIQENKN